MAEPKTPEQLQAKVEAHRAELRAKIEEADSDFVDNAKLRKAWKTKKWIIIGYPTMIMVDAALRILRAEREHSDQPLPFTPFIIGLYAFLLMAALVMVMGLRQHTELERKAEAEEAKSSTDLGPNPTAPTA